MPVLAVGAAVMAGVEIATVGIAAMTAFEVVAAVGAIAAGIGVVTGNEDLVKIGGVMGVVGGIGSIAQGSGLFGIGGETGEAASSFESATAASQAATEVTPTVTNAATQAVENALPSTELNTLGRGSLTDEMSAAINGTPAAQPGLINQPKDYSAFTGATPADVPKPLPDQVIAPGAPAVDYAKISGTTSTGSSILDKVLGFAKENDKLSAAMLQVGGSFVQGMFDPKNDAQIAALNAQTAAAQAQAAALQQRTAANAAPLPQARAANARPSVYGQVNPATYQSPAVTGLINSPAITGRV